MMGVNWKQFQEYDGALHGDEIIVRGEYLASDGKPSGSMMHAVVTHAPKLSKINGYDWVFDGGDQRYIFLRPHLFCEMPEG